ncbi:hypothetical protein ACFV06_01810 [Streptomyces sp. NPDC059618]|uniref:hypothetical protein n=1 Tax=Streptomyces sp. NPDC059618 TaxID=3346887 RepID=UPI0036BAABD0
MTLLPATQALLDRRSGDDPPGASWQWESMAAEVVLRHGGPADAQALLPLFVSAPAAHEALVPVLARHGDRRLAARLLEATVEGGRLREDVPSGVLHALGLLGCASATSLLWEHVDDSYDVSKDACLGLLHLPCEELRDAITERLEEHEGAALFPEFLPALAPKTKDPAWLERLVAWGENDASVDCNGGLILGISLYGGPARAAFTRLLWDTRWEACGSGTGSAWWTYTGTRVLGLGLPRLYADLRARLRAGADPDAQKDALWSFITLVRLRCADIWTGVRAAEVTPESYDTLYGLLFAPTPDDSDTPTGPDGLSGPDALDGPTELGDLVRHVFGSDDPLADEVRHLETALRTAAAHEWALRAAVRG